MVVARSNPHLTSFATSVMRVYVWVISGCVQEWVCVYVLLTHYIIVRPNVRDLTVNSNNEMKMLTNVQTQTRAPETNKIFVLLQSVLCC